MAQEMEFAEARVGFTEMRSDGEPDIFEGKVCLSGGWLHRRTEEGRVESHPAESVAMVLWYADEPATG